VILALLAMAYFNVFWEVIPLFFLSDLLYGTRGEKNAPIFFISFIISIIILVAIEITKRKLKFYS